MRNAWLSALTLLGASLCFGAEVYPSKAVRVVVPFAPGGSTDFTARVISQQLSEQLGQSFVVDNRTGASGTIANGIVARSAPDGYTLMLADTSTTIVPGLFKSLPFDVARDFTPITQIIGGPNVLVVHPSLKANTLKEFIALAQANPGKLNYGSAGAGGLNHLMAELFKLAAKVNITHIPYKGAGEVVPAVLGGQVDMLVATIPTVLAYVNSGKLRALAVTTDGKRAPSMPDVPSMSEAGVSGMTIYAWYGLVGPAGMPKEIVNKLHTEVVKAIAVPSVKERFITQGGEPVGSSPEEFSTLVRNELRRWAEVIKSAGNTPE
jgi:tripartite-type tricarboxylate transporter receptor subunit TctC